MSDRHFAHWPPRLPRCIAPPRTSLWFNLECSAMRFPDKTAVNYYGAVTSYAQLARDAILIAGYLQERCGVKRGDRVALYAQNSPQFIAAYYGILRADAMVVPISPMLVSGEVGKICNDSGARVCIAAQDLLPNLDPLLGGTLDHVIACCYCDALPERTDLEIPEAIRAPYQSVERPGVVAWREVLQLRIEPAPHRATADDWCVLPYTSGTTGEPKGCMHRHSSVAHTAIGVSQWSGVVQGDCVLVALPLSHVTGMQNSMNTPIYAGATMVVLSRWNRDTAAEVIRRCKVTRWTAVPTMVVDLLSSPNIERYELGSLLEIGGGGAAMPQAIAQKLKKLCGITYTEGYGLSETMAPSHINPVQRLKEQCLGIPIFDTDSRVVDPQTFVELPPGEVGEIVTRGPQVFDGYWNKPQATAEAFVEIDGERFFRTGDLARTDEDGYFHFVDRLKRMINAAGLKVWPAEVESQLYAHPDVQEAVIIGARCPRKGEIVKALLVLKPAARDRLKPEEIIEWARSRMASYKLPQAIEFVESLPKSPTGKIAWRQLQERENHAAS